MKREIVTLSVQAELVRKLGYDIESIGPSEREKNRYILLKKGDKFWDGRIYFSWEEAVIEAANQLLRARVD